MSSSNLGLSKGRVPSEETRQRMGSEKVLKIEWPTALHGCSATSRGSIYLHPALLSGMIDESYWQPLQRQPVQLIIYSVQLHQTINHSAKLNKTKTLLYDKAGNRTWAGRQSHCTSLSVGIARYIFFDFSCSSAKHENSGVTTCHWAETIYIIYCTVDQYTSPSVNCAN